MSTKRDSVIRPGGDAHAKERRFLSKKGCRFVPSGQGQNTGGIRRCSNLTRPEHGHDRFSVISRDDPQFSCHWKEYCGVAVAGKPLELIQQPVTGKILVLMVKAAMNKTSQSLPD